MQEWININDKMPDTETECILAYGEGTSLKTYPKLSMWDGSVWVDVDGEVVENVGWWMKAPLFENGHRIIEKLMRCVENDHCEIKDCCYFVMLDELQTLLKYVKN